MKEAESIAKDFAEKVLGVRDPEAAEKIIGGIAASLKKCYKEVTTKDFEMFSGDELRDFYYGIIY